MESRKKSGRKLNSNVILAASAVILCIASVIIFVIQQNNDAASLNEISAAVSNNATEYAAEEKTDENNAQTIAEGESLVISVSDISSSAAFYTVEVDGMTMEVFAVADSEGNIRTAFNTCQICYSSGHGYYVQEGDIFVCQNCGNRFTADQIEIQSGGCNPWPIFSENKAVTDDTIEISYDFLNESKEIFSNWRTQY